MNLITNNLYSASSQYNKISAATNNRMNFTNNNGLTSSSFTGSNLSGSNSGLQTINHSQNNNNDWTWQDIRKTIGDVIPPLATLFLTIASFFGGASLLESLIEPISGFFNWTSLLIIASDLPSIFEGVGESITQIKEVILHPSFKGLLYAFSKIIPLYFIAEIFAGRNLLDRMLKGREHLKKSDSLFSKLRKSKSLANIASISEAVKAQFLNLGGNSLLRTLTWFARRAVINNYISKFPFIKIQNKEKIETLIQSLATLWLALASSLLPRSQYKVQPEDLK